MKMVCAVLASMVVGCAGGDDAGNPIDPIDGTLETVAPPDAEPDTSSDDVMADDLDVESAPGLTDVDGDIDIEPDGDMDVEPDGDGAAAVDGDGDGDGDGALEVDDSVDADSDNEVSPEVGYTWTLVNPTAAFAPRDGAGAVVLAGRMWLLGGWNPLDPINFPDVTNAEVWSSVDGFEWTLELLAAPWEGRHVSGYVSLAGRMWVIGGDPNRGHYQNDVWSSVDGKVWERATERVPWENRVLFHTVMKDGAVFVMGGQTLPQFAPEVAATLFYNDVWRSEDGASWTRITENAGWSARGMIGGQAVLNGRMWLLGGGTYDTPEVPAREFNNDVWSSADGVTWRQDLAEAPWEPRQFHDVAAWDGKLWVIAGYHVGNLADVWYSADGQTWLELPNTPWAARHASSIFVHQDALWVVTGNNMTSDVWKLTRSAP